MYNSTSVCTTDPGTMHPPARQFLALPVQLCHEGDVLIIFKVAAR